MSFFNSFTNCVVFSKINTLLKYILFISIISLSSNNFYGQCADTSTNGDCDGDGITNINDLDDDNDGILDTDEGYIAPSLINTPQTVNFSNVTTGAASAGLLSNIESCNNVDLSINYSFTSKGVNIPELIPNTSNSDILDISYSGGLSGTSKKVICVGNYVIVKNFSKII